MATSESTTQPIICCIGENVAGLPTQFMLERAFEALRMPWQALSVEINSEKFSLICEACLAMGFQGLRFYGALESLANQIGKGQLSSFVGSATSALRAVDQWQTWDNRGPAWLQTLGFEDSSATMPSIWIHGSDTISKSVCAAILNLDTKDSATWVWTGAPNELTSVEQPAIQTALANGRIVLSDQPINFERLQSLLNIGSTGASEATDPVALAVILPDATLSNQFADAFSNWNIRLTLPHDLKVPASISGLVDRRISQADIAVAGEAYDFFRWTKSRADLGLLRDAYDEYCDF
jgi:hypothetical protein